jgi:hypothetical protein
MDRVPNTERASVSRRAVVAIAVGLGLVAGFVTYLAADATTAVLIGVTVAFCAAAGLAVGIKIDEEHGDWLRGHPRRERRQGISAAPKRHL